MGKPGRYRQKFKRGQVQAANSVAQAIFHYHMTQIEPRLARLENPWWKRLYRRTKIKVRSWLQKARKRPQVPPGPTISPSPTSDGGS